MVEGQRIVSVTVPNALLREAALDVASVAGCYTRSAKRGGATGLDAKFIGSIYTLLPEEVMSGLTEAFARIERTFGSVAEELPDSMRDKKEITEFMVGYVASSLEKGIFTAVALARIRKNYGPGTEKDEVAKLLLERSGLEIMRRILGAAADKTLMRWALDNFERYERSRYSRSEEIDMDFRPKDLMALVCDIRDGCGNERGGMLGSVARAIDFRARNGKWLDWFSIKTPAELLFRESKEVSVQLRESFEESVMNDIFEAAVAVLGDAVMIGGWDALNWTRRG